VVIFGDADFVSNQINQLPIQSNNRDLFLNAANWLAEQEDLINVRARPTETRQMLLQGWQSNLIFYSSVLFLPLAVLAAGVAVWWSRR
jgi:ABC-type uncharacterized transport system involved in gliding motility auxiliary subunit